MPGIEFHQLTKHYGAVTALDGLTAEVVPGRITAFLGANGSGKTTSMRLLLGLSEPDSGHATIGHERYVDLAHPTRRVGAVLDQGFHPNRSARNHLRIVAAQAGVPAARAEEVLDLVELTSVARRRVGGFSLGMRQRLALASALVGDPAALVMDEPFNRLDPAGIATMRAFLRTFADQGGTVFLSSHLLAEVAHTADDAIVIHRGRLVSAGPVSDLSAAPAGVVVTTLDADLLAVTLARRGATVERTGPDALTVTGATRDTVGRAAADIGAVVTGMHGTGDPRVRLRRPHPPPGGNPVISLVRIELLKLRTTPAVFVALSLALFLTLASVLTTILIAGQPGTAPVGSVENVSQLLAIGVVTSFSMLILGVMLSAGEDRHRTSRGTYLAEPRRGRVLVAKLLTAAIVGVLGGAVIFGLDLVIALPVYAARGVHHLPVNVVALWTGTTLLTACFGLLGVALGALTRNTVAAIIGALVWAAVIELSFLQPLFPSLGMWLPTGAAVSLTTATDHSALLPPGIAALVLIGWATLVALLAGRITLRRELR